MASLTTSSMLLFMAAQNMAATQPDAMWRAAYWCDYAATTRYVKAMDKSSLDDVIRSQFYYAYALWKEGHKERSYQIFEIVDHLIEEKLIIPYKKEETPK